MRRVAAILIGLALLGIPAANAAHTGAQRLPGVADHGCSLYTSPPNPCDPESNN